MEGEYDMILGNTGLKQIPRDPVFSAVALNPDFTLTYVHMHQTPMHSPQALTPDKHQQIVIRFAVKDGLDLNVPIGIGNLSVVGQDTLNDLAIRCHGIHWRMTSLVDL